MNTPKSPIIPQAATTVSTPDENRRMVVSSSPHVAALDSTRGIMLDVLIALLPALVVSVFFYGFRSLVLTLITVAACIAFEWLYRAILKKPNSTGDLSAAVTGVLLAFNLPASTPYWVPVVGAAFSIIIVKQLYGGIGKNFINPALAGRAFVMFCFPAYVSTWTPAFEWLPLGGTVDAVTSATPLASMKEGLLPSASAFEMFLGKTGGCLGETCALVLLLGGAYLVLRRVISVRIPLIYLGTVALVTFVFPLGGAARVDWMLANLLSGGLMLGAIFMATDYTTSPVTPRGQVLFAVGCGLLTVFIRYFGSYAEGVSFSILIMNVCVWLFDKVGKPARYGERRAKNGGK